MKANEGSEGFHYTIDMLNNNLFIVLFGLIMW